MEEKVQPVGLEHLVEYLAVIGLLGLARKDKAFGTIVIAPAAAGKSKLISEVGKVFSWKLVTDATSQGIHEAVITAHKTTGVIAFPELNTLITGRRKPVDLVGALNPVLGAEGLQSKVTGSAAYNWEASGQKAYVVMAVTPDGLKGKAAKVLGGYGFISRFVLYSFKYTRSEERRIAQLQMSGLEVDWEGAIRKYLNSLNRPGSFGLDRPVLELIERIAQRMVIWKQEYLKRSDAEQYYFREIAQLRTFADGLSRIYGRITEENVHYFLSFVPFLNPNISGNNLMFRMIREIGENEPMSVGELIEKMKGEGYTWKEIDDARTYLLHKLALVEAIEKDGEVSLIINRTLEDWGW